LILIYRNDIEGISVCKKKEEKIWAILML